jgi:transglutaminase-like putative cysteine protease
MVLMLYIHPSRQQDVQERETLTIEPFVQREDFFDDFGNHCCRIVAPPGVIRLIGNATVADSGLPDSVFFEAEQHPVEALPTHVLPYLLSSRFCELERFTDIAWNLFGHTAPGWSRASAVCAWVHNHVAFGYQYARSDKTAWDVYMEQRGVCRDYMHLSIALLRALNIPARYATGYLGDICVPPVPFPMDFSAWYEVYLGGQWHTFDARHNTRRVGRVLMARGRDATDVALTTTFGKHDLRKFTVWTDEVG